MSLWLRTLDNTGDSNFIVGFNAISHLAWKSTTTGVLLLTTLSWKSSSSWTLKDTRAWGEVENALVEHDDITGWMGASALCSLFAETAILSEDWPSRLRPTKRRITCLCAIFYLLSTSYKISYVKLMNSVIYQKRLIVNFKFKVTKMEKILMFKLYLSNVNYCSFDVTHMP